MPGQCYLAAISYPPGAVRGRQLLITTANLTSLKVDLAPERLIIINAMAAVVFLAIGGLFVLLIALTGAARIVPGETKLLNFDPAVDAFVARP